MKKSEPKSEKLETLTGRVVRSFHWLKKFGLMSGELECEHGCCDRDSWAAPGPQRSSAPQRSSDVSGGDSGGIPTSNERSSDPRSSSSVSGGRPPARGSSRGPSRGRVRSRGRGHVRSRGHFLSRGRVPVPRKSPTSVLAVLLFASVLFFAGNLDGSEGPAWAMSPVSENAKLVDLPLVMDLSLDLDELLASFRSGGTAASSRVSCQSGYSLTSDGLACEKRESRAASLSCPAGSSQFSLGVAPAWGCRRDLGAAATTYSCSQGVLVTVSNGFQGGRACKVTSSSTESKNASANCNPRGTPPSCSYTATVLTRQSQSASSSCSPSGSPPNCSYTAPVLVRQSKGASSNCTPAGSPPSCSYTALVSTRESKSASRYCSPSGVPPSCRHSVKQSSSATYHYIPGVGGYFYCSSGWTLSGSSCYRYVTSYGSLRYSCPSGWTLSGGTCYRYSSSRVTRYGTLSYSCSSGWTLSGSTCYRYLSSTVTRYGSLSYSCSSGWTLSGSSCYRYSSSTVTRYGTLSYECSSGWTLSGSTCSRTTTSVRYVSPSSSLSCSSGTLVGGKCWSYPAKVKSCPDGWTLSSGSCTRTLTASPIYTYSCPQGRTLRGTRCYVTPTTTTTTSTTTTTTAATTTTTTTTTTAAPPPPTTTSSTTTTTTAATTTTSSTTSTTLVACPAGEFRLGSSAVCVGVPAAALDASAGSSSGGVDSYPGVGSLILVWRLSDNFPANYRVRWKEASVASYPSPGPDDEPLKASSLEVDVPAPYLLSRGRLYAHTITGLKTCTVYDVELKGYSAANALLLTREFEGTPKGTPASVRDAELLVMSAEGNEVRVFWRKPACDGGSPLRGYKVRWKYEDESEDDRKETIVGVDSDSDGSVEEYYGYRIESTESKPKFPSPASPPSSSSSSSSPPLIDLPQELPKESLKTKKSRDVEVLAFNVHGDSPAAAFSGAPAGFIPEMEPPRVTFTQGDEESLEAFNAKTPWHPYVLPNGEPDSKHPRALLSEKLQRGETVTVCTRVGDFAEGLRAAGSRWNAVISGALRVEVLGSSSAKSCGEKTATETENNNDTPREKSASTTFDVVVMDYRPVCAPPPLEDERRPCCPLSPDISGDCDDSSCDYLIGRAAASASCGFSDSTPHCAKADGCAYVRANGDTGYEPDLLEGSVIHITGFAGDAELVRYIVHEVGHFLGLGDYGLGCHRLTSNTAVKSVMSYGWRALDWRDWQRRVITQDAGAVECQTSTPSSKDKADLRSIYVPAAFQNPSFVRKGSSGDEWQLKFGLPPTDTLGSESYNAYAYVVFYRTGSTGALQLLKDNQGKASLTTGNPIHIAPGLFQDSATSGDSEEDSEDSVEGAVSGQDGDDLGSLVDHVLSDGSTQKVFQLNLMFDAGEVSGLRGKQFVIAGVTRTQFAGSVSTRASVSLNLLTDDPASETWWVGELSVATIPARPSSSP